MFLFHNYKHTIRILCFFYKKLLTYHAEITLCAGPYAVEPHL